MCLGHTHSLMGLAAGVATLPYAPVSGVAGQLGWIAVCGGMAFLPDLDMPRSSVSQVWGSLTSRPAELVCKVARGHRNGTHDAILSPVVFGGIASVAATWGPTRLVLVALAIGLALRACHFVIPGRNEFNQVWNALWSFTLAGMIVTHGGPHVVDWLPLAVIVGILAHLLGDAFTVQGLPIPLWWLWVDLFGPPKREPEPQPKGKGTRKAKGKPKARWYDDGRMELPSWKVRVWFPTLRRPRGTWLPRIRCWHQIRLGAFATGHWFERWVVFPAAALALVVLIITNTRVGEMWTAAQTVAEQGIARPSPAPTLVHPATKHHRAL